jgi:hypothetical protein
VARTDSPPSFAFWSCGSSPALRAITAARGDIVAVVSSDDGRSDEVLILVDFKSKRSWPDPWGRKVNDDARQMLELLRREHGELWLYQTENHELTRLRP